VFIFSVSLPWHEVTLWLLLLLLRSKRPLTQFSIWSSVLKTFFLKEAQVAQVA